MKVVENTVEDVKFIIATMVCFVLVAVWLFYGLRSGLRIMKIYLSATVVFIANHLPLNHLIVFTVTKDRMLLSYNK